MGVDNKTKQPPMRTIKELLVLVRDRFEMTESSCLCSALAKLYVTDRCIINKEYWFVVDYMKRNKPENASLSSMYWFPPYEKQPRLDWLDKHINLNEK